MTIYFLMTKLIDPSKQRVSGGVISNLRMIERIAGSTKVVFIPMLTASVPESLKASDNLSLDLAGDFGFGRLGYVVERYFKYRHRIKRAIKSHGPGILISTRATIPVAHQVSLEFGLPLVLVTRAFEDLEQAGLRAPSKKMTLFRRLEGVLNRSNIVRAYRDADLVVTNSEYMVKEHRQLFNTESPFHVSYPPMDIPKGKPTVNEVDTIGFINKGAHKGVDLISALARILPQKTFLIFGTPLELRGSDLSNVKNIGYMSDRESMFRSADLFLVPSIWDEPYGRVAAEALWSGRPVVVSKKGGLPEAAPNELFWQEGDVPELWAAKIRCLSELSRRSEVSAAIESAQQYFESNKDHLVKKLLKMLPG